jgi:hypothetical protein
MPTDETITTRILYRLVPPTDDPDLQTPSHRLNPKTRHLLEAYEQILKVQDVTHYFTLTAARRISAGLLRSKFNDWVDAIEWIQGRHLGWFRADESRWSGHGFPAIPLHFHGVLIAANHLNIQQACYLWRDLAGDARVDIYDPSRRAVRYCLKQAVLCTDYDLGGKAYRPFANDPSSAHMPVQEVI